MAPNATKPELDIMIHLVASETQIAGTCEASRFDSNRPLRFDSKVIGRFEKFSNRPCVPIACRSQTTQTINGAYSGLVVQYTDLLALCRYCLMCLRIGMSRDLSRHDFVFLFFFGGGIVIFFLNLISRDSRLSRLM